MARAHFPLRAAFFVDRFDFFSVERTGRDDEYLAFYPPAFDVSFSKRAGSDACNLSRIYPQIRAFCRICRACFFRLSRLFLIFNRVSAKVSLYNFIHPRYFACRAR